MTERRGIPVGVADVRAAWQTAARELGVAATVPFVLQVEGRAHACVAWVPDFGGPRGTVVMPATAPDFAVDPTFVADAERAGYRWSALSVAAYHTFDRELFVATLADWGFTGPSDVRPAWLG